MKKIGRKIDSFPITSNSPHFLDNRSQAEKMHCLMEDERAIKQYDVFFRQHYISGDSEAKDFKQQTEVEKIKQEFDNLVKTWVSDIKYKSIESQQINHDAFLRIIAIADKVLPSVFQEFSKRPFMAWLRVLPAITGQNIASEAKSFPEAVRLWIEWGKQNDYLPK
jgi:hypothetical protein